MTLSPSWSRKTREHVELGTLSQHGRDPRGETCSTSLSGQSNNLARLDVPHTPCDTAQYLASEYSRQTMEPDTTSCEGGGGHS
jgi:hypothetical protein